MPYVTACICRAFIHFFWTFIFLYSGPLLILIAFEGFLCTFCENLSNLYTFYTLVYDMFWQFSILPLLLIYSHPFFPKIPETNLFIPFFMVYKYHFIPWDLAYFLRTTFWRHIQLSLFADFLFSFLTFPHNILFAIK